MAAPYTVLKTRQPVWEARLGRQSRDNPDSSRQACPYNGKQI